MQVADGGMQEMEAREKDVERHYVRGDPGPCESLGDTRAPRTIKDFATRVLPW